MQCKATATSLSQESGAAFSLTQREDMTQSTASIPASAPAIDPAHNTHIGLETETMVIFGVLALLALCLDIWAHRKDKPIALKSAIAWTLFWISISMSFALFLYFHFNGEVASLFLAGYLFEQALSVDNLFVMMAIFAWFKVPEQFCHRVLYWGVLGAIFFRLLFVVIGSSLFALGPVVELIFALMVAGSGFMMLRKKDGSEETNVDYTHHIAYRAVRMFFPMYPRLVGHSFFIKHSQVEEELKKPENAGIVLKRTGPIFATPLFLCLAVIETTDVMFAFDSVPAVIAVSREPLIVYSAMIFAVLGLRSMYFVLDAMRQYLIHLEKAVTVLLFFIAFKLAASASLHLFGFGIDIDVYTSLLVIAVILGLGIVASFIFPDKKKKEAVATAAAATSTEAASEAAPATEATATADAAVAAESSAEPAPATPVPAAASKPAKENTAEAAPATTEAEAQAQAEEAKAEAPAAEAEAVAASTEDKAEKADK